MHTPPPPQPPRDATTRAARLATSTPRQEALARREQQIKESLHARRGCGGCRGRSITR